jgi:hypothetical protein
MALFYPSFRPTGPGTSRWISLPVAVSGRSSAGKYGARWAGAALPLLGVGRGEELDRDGTR